MYDDMFWAPAESQVWSTCLSFCDSISVNVTYGTNIYG